MVLVYPATKTMTHKTNQKEAILDLYVADGKQVTTTEILMDTIFFEYTVPHVLRKLAFFCMIYFDKHYTRRDLKF